MAISNPATAPNWVSACMAVVICGDRFSERLEQEALLNILVFTEQEHAWPTGTAKLTLEEAWGWQTTQMDTRSARWMSKLKQRLHVRSLDASL